MEEDRGQTSNFIIIALANDYEPFEILMEEVAKSTAQAHTPFSRRELIEALRELIETGFVKSVVYNQRSAKFEARQFSEEVADTLLYCLTKRGEEYLRQLGY